MEVCSAGDKNGWRAQSAVNECMETLSIGGRRYSDPDILSLARQTGELICPRFTIKMQARELLKKMLSYPGVPRDAFERVRILASLKGIKVQAMSIEMCKSEKRDAALYRTDSGWLALYNPNRPTGRVAFTLAHEIIHTLFPNSVNGARFRTITNPDSREANELERLCDLGAAELVLPIDEFQEKANGEYSLRKLEQLAAHFGTSLEATAYRLATAHPGFAVAGLLRYRFTVSEARQLKGNETQSVLFGDLKFGVAPTATKKYRRQSLHLSENCGDEYIIRWNKSFDLSSVVYRTHTRGIYTAIEHLPNLSGKLGRIEAMLDPYRQKDADPKIGDVLFFWEEL